MLRPISFAVLALLSFFFAGINASPFQLMYRANKPIPPLQDPFYDPPEGFASKKPGAILRYRSAPIPLTFGGNVTVNSSAAFQILYRTTNSLGKATSTVTTLIIPKNPDLTKHVSFQPAYDSAYENCSPSYYLQQGHLNGSQQDILLANLVFNRGYILSVPDYEGPRAAYTSGIISGQATLDSVRAVLNSAKFSHISPKAKTVLWGYSGGALASEWATELQPLYAPELKGKIIGAACGGLTPNVTSVLETINGGPSASTAPPAIIGLSNAYPNFSRWLDNNLVPKKAAAFRVPASACGPDISNLYANQNLYDYFIHGRASLEEPVPKSVSKWAGVMGLRSTPQIPLYMYKGTADELSPIIDTTQLKRKYCRAGASVEYVRYENKTHTPVASIGAGRAVAWLVALFEGQSPVKGCNSTLIS